MVLNESDRKIMLCSPRLMLRSLEWVVVVNDGQLLVQVISCFVILPVMSQSWQFREENHGPLEDCIDRLRAKLNTADAMNIVYRSENRDLERQVDKLVQEKLDLEAQVNYLQQRLAELAEQNRRFKMTHPPMQK